MNRKTHPMKLSQFAGLLQTHPEKPFQLVLPGDNTVPASFHITEVGHVTKKFIDCGGKLHTKQACQLQAWVYTDTDHRLLAGKMAGVLGLAKSKGILPDGEDLDVEIEYEDTVISQYAVENFSVSEGAVVLRLAGKHTDCLAKESCLPSLPMMSGAAAASCGCGPSGCC
jgi:hypothetical protein